VLWAGGNKWVVAGLYTEDQLASITASFTVVQAIEDEAIIDEHAEKMASLMSSATCIPMDGVSHFALWQEPQRLNETITEFLAAK
jgi:pimeloyl-ACP methyl ester carboxylesterase